MWGSCVGWQVVDAVKSGNHSRFFELYRDAPRMSPYLMDAIADKIRCCPCPALLPKPVCGFGACKA